LPANVFYPLTGVALAAALCGCTSTDAVAPTPSFTQAAESAGSDAGFPLVLPETVAVLPEPSGREAAVAEAAPASPAVPEVTPAAFAGPTPAAKAAFPAAPEPVGRDATVVASIEPVSYAGPVPAYLAPPPSSTNAFDAVAAPKGRGEIEKLIEKYAALYEVPVGLVRHVVNRESTFNPKAYNNGHWGLMQIKHQTARGMGYRGPASGLFDAETNLKYAVKYLRGAWLVAGRDQKRADRLYQTGYYYEAKRKGMLEATGLGIDRKRRHAREQEVRLDPERLVRPPVLPVGASG
jgi:soluble lytic murein transglycosylase-like protein